MKSEAVILSIMLSLIPIAPLNILHVVVEQNQLAETRPDIASLEDHEPIHISSNDEFTVEGFTGSGIEEDPYLIEGLHIASSAWCMRITTTTAYFLIRNCSFEGLGRGIELLFVEHGRIENCTFTNSVISIDATQVTNCSVNDCYSYLSQSAIVLDRADWTNLTNIDINAARSAIRSIHLTASNDLYLENITISQGGPWSSLIDIVGCSKILLSEIEILSSYTAINVDTSEYVTIQRSKIHESQSAVVFDHSVFSSLRNSTLNSTHIAIGIYQSISCLIENCRIKGEPWYSMQFFESEDIICENVDLGVGLVEITGNSFNYWTHHFTNVTDGYKEVQLITQESDQHYDLSNKSQVFIVFCSNMTFDMSGQSPLSSIVVISTINCDFNNIYLNHSKRTQLSILQSDMIHFSNLTDASLLNSIVEVDWCTSIWFSNSEFENVSLDISNSDSCRIISGEINSTTQGVQISSSQLVWILNCTIESNDFSILVQSSRNVTIQDCELNNPLDIRGSYELHFNHVIENVTINSKRIGFITGRSQPSGQTLSIGLEIYSQIFLFECTNILLVGWADAVLTGLSIIKCENVEAHNFAFFEGINSGIVIDECENVTLRNVVDIRDSNIRLENSQYLSISSLQVESSGIQIYDISFISLRDNIFDQCTLGVNICDNLLFSNNLLSTDYYPFHLDALQNSTIINSAIVSTDDDGIEGWSVIGCTISNNSITCYGDGIKIDQGTRIEICQNTINGAMRGIELNSVSDSEINLNRITNTLYAGIFGTYLGGCQFTRNAIHDTSGHGFRIEDSNDISISINYIVRNNGTGIMLVDTDFSRIWGNFLDNNTQGNAIAAGSENQWTSFENLMGNYWGPSGINTIYDFEGGIHAIDQLPISLFNNKSTLPAMTQERNYEVLFGESNRVVKWIIWTLDEVNVKLMVDGIEVDSVTISSPTLMLYNVSSYGLGPHSYSLSVYINGTMILQDSIVVNVIASYALISSIIAGVSILSTLVLLELRRRNSFASDPQ